MTKASYSNCAFTLSIPSCLVYDDHVKFSYQFRYKECGSEIIVYYRAVHTDRVKVIHKNDSNGHLFNHNKVKKIGENTSFCIYADKKKIFMGNSHLDIEFLSSTGEKTVVGFNYETKDKVKLASVSRIPMNEEEKDFYVKALNPQNTIIDRNNEDDKGDDIEERYEIVDDMEHMYDGFDEDIPVRPDLPEFEKYRRALRTEKYYLKYKGGRDYKVTNGKMISQKNSIFAYVFDLETELHIADDSPVRVSAGGSEAAGTVLLCEDFQIIVMLERNIGERINEGRIKVEPWKLLEALQKRIYYFIGKKKNPVSEILLTDGKRLASNKDINLIPKGQDAAIKKAMSDQVCVIWGPPGTGKTHTMSEMAIQFMEKDQTILIVSHSNVSVDGVAKKIDELLRERGMDHYLKEGKVLRYGYVRDEELSKNPDTSSFYYTVSKNPRLKQQLDSKMDEYQRLKQKFGLGREEVVDLYEEINTIRAQLREQEQYYVNKASVVATTISKISVDKLFEWKKYDVVMFDEVSMAYVPQVMCASTFAKKHLICVGDFMQLAPIALSKEKDFLCEDLFSYLGIYKNGQMHYHPWLVMLDEQRRMHPAISAFANKHVYKNLLRDHVSTRTSRTEIINAELFKNHATNLIDLTGSYCAASKNSDNSRFNILSAFISFAAAIQTEENVGNVSIITPYAAQTRLIRALVLDYRQKNDSNIRCVTVHQFQGSESDVVFFDAVESYPAKKPGWLMSKDFNSILRLINVAVTRARGKLVTVANGKFWDNNYRGTNHTFYKLVSHLTSQGNVVSHSQNMGIEELVEKLSVKNGPVFYLNPEQYMSELEKDILSAKKKIVISLPSANLDEKYADIIFKWIEKKKLERVPVLIKCKEYSCLDEKWKQYSWGSEDAVFPVIIIDDHITWYGVPQASWKFVDGNSTYATICNIACRMKGEHTAEIIRSLTDLEQRETVNGKVPLLSKDTEEETGIKTGFSEYVQTIRKCTICKRGLSFTRGKSGKAILWCKECKKSELIHSDDVNHYVLVNYVRCPQCNSEIEAKIGQYGLYIKCDRGHKIKPEEI